jgi:hypothetical protein
MNIGPILPAYPKPSDTKNPFTGVHESLMKVELGIDNSTHNKKAKSFRPKNLGTKLYNQLLRGHLHH